VTPPIADARDRALIADALDTTLVVEAAAGTGKTTELVKRIVRLVETGATIDQIVAVTFSEKAAGELKLRLREQLEHARAAATGNAVATLERAVQRFEEAHVSTIHGFCADLLRERPVEARIDPSFAVLTEGQASRLFDEAFTDWLQQELDDPCEGVRRSLRRVTVRRFGQDEDDDAPIERLKRAGRELLEWRDHPAPWTRPDGFSRDRDIDHLLDGMATLCEATRQPSSPRDPLARALERVRRVWADIEPLRRRGQPDYDGWEGALCALAGEERDLRAGRRASGQFSKQRSNAEVIQARDSLVDALVAFRNAADADLAAQVHEALGAAVRLYDVRKRRAGAVDFLDLLIEARNLVRDDAEVRRDFQRRFRYLLVDEFQDTDPLQAELLLLLASDGDADDDTPPVERRVRPGALFIVGDRSSRSTASAGRRRRVSRNLRTSRERRREAGAAAHELQRAGHPAGGERRLQHAHDRRPPVAAGRLRGTAAGRSDVPSSRGHRAPVPRR
jgi:ATP-dependent exoDNAse (exonuclease V) beta subunit